MSDHKISSDGLSIECLAGLNAPCRRRPQCDAERWEDHGCQDHDPAHATVGGQSCWLLPWVNSTLLDETYDGPGAPVTIYPGRPVRVSWYEDYCSWDYHRGADDSVADQPNTVAITKFNNLKDKLNRMTGSPGLTSLAGEKVHMTLGEWERLIECIASAQLRASRAEQCQPLLEACPFDDPAEPRKENLQ